MKTPKLSLKNLRCKATTLAELMVSSAVSTLIAGALIVGCIAVQRSFYASIQYAKNQAQQVRLLDYMALDLRRATHCTITRGANPATPDGDPDVSLELQIPDYYNEITGTSYEPVVNNMHEVEYNNGAMVTVRYEKEGNSIVRKETQGGTTTKRTVANDVLNWQTREEAPKSSVLTVWMTFTPTFRQSNQQLGNAGTKLFIRILMRNKTTDTTII